MSFHAGQTFTFGETPSATKWNYLWENDYALQDWSAFTASSLPLSLIANRTRSVAMPFFAEGTGGAASSVTLGMPAVNFTGTPSGYLRANVVIPEDYVAGTDVVIRLKTYASNSATHTARRYVNADAVGDSLSSLWDVDSNVQTTGLVYTANILKEIDITVAAANLAAGSLLSLAWRIETAITGNVWVEHLSLRYTADS